MKASEIRDLSKEELEHKYLDLKKELFNLKTTSKIGRIENPSRINHIKKDIARIKTIMKEKERHGSEEPKA